CSVVENGTDRPDEHNEFRDFAHLPRAWLRNELRTHVIRWDRHLGEVIEQIVGEHLDGLHGQEWHPGTCTEHTNPVPEICTAPHSNVFQNVCEDFATLTPALFL